MASYSGEPSEQPLSGSYRRDFAQVSPTEARARNVEEELEHDDRPVADRCDQRPAALGLDAGRRVDVLAHAHDGPTSRSRLPPAP